MVRRPRARRRGRRRPPARARSHRRAEEHRGRVGGGGGGVRPASSPRPPVSRQPFSSSKKSSAMPVSSTAVVPWLRLLRARSAASRQCPRARGCATRTRSAPKHLSDARILRPIAAVVMKRRGPGVDGAPAAFGVEGGGVGDIGTRVGLEAGAAQKVLRHPEGGSEGRERRVHAEESAARVAGRLGARRSSRGGIPERRVLDLGLLARRVAERAAALTVCIQRRQAEQAVQVDLVLQLRHVLPVSGERSSSAQSSCSCLYSRCPPRIPRPIWCSCVVRSAASNVFDEPSSACTFRVRPLLLNVRHSTFPAALRSRLSSGGATKRTSSTHSSDAIVLPCGLINLSLKKYSRSSRPKSRGRLAAPRVRLVAEVGELSAAAVLVGAGRRCLLAHHRTLPQRR